MSMIEKSATHAECDLSDTDLFSPAFVQRDILHGNYEEIFPITKLEDSGPVEFSVENSREKLL